MEPGAESLLPVDGIEAGFMELASAAALGVEVIVILVVVIGAIEAMGGVFRLMFATGNSDDLRRAIWLRFAVWIVLALEFALAADIIRTAVAPSWDSIGKLGAIAAIRTLLNWFLVRDIERMAPAAQASESE